jgi:hypothetical protein
LERVLKVLHGEIFQQQQQVEEPEPRAESEAMVKKLAAIPEAEKAPRGSKRRAASVDQDCAKRA